MPEGKVLSFEDAVARVEDLKRKGRTVVLSLGVFDLVHPGITQHLADARRMGDALVAAVIRDSDVRRGPGRPIFPDHMRAANIASLEQVDFACVVPDETPFESVRHLKPDVFAKGQAYKTRDRKLHDRIFDEERDLYFGKTLIQETSGFSFSSSGIINSFLDLYSEDTRQFIRKFAQKYSMDDIMGRVNGMAGMKVLLVGDGIIDEYHYCASMSKSAKAHLVVSKYLDHEVFAGGAFAIANHVAGLCDEVGFVTLLGAEDTRQEFVEKNLKPNVRPKFFFREDGPTIVKKRYIQQYLNQKLFEVNYMNDRPVSGRLEEEIVGWLEAEIPKYDLVLVSDFGHGLMTERIIRTVQRLAPRLAVNAQANAANMGFNMITKYEKPHFVCLDETEARLTMQDKFGEMEDVATGLFRRLGVECLVVTLGKRGAVGISRRDGLSLTPIFSTKIVDTVGAGDAVFSFVALCFASGCPLDLLTFIGNAVGALKVQIVCNKKSVEKHELFQFIGAMLQQKG